MYINERKAPWKFSGVPKPLAAFCFSVRTARLCLLTTPAHPDILSSHFFYIAKHIMYAFYAASTLAQIAAGAAVPGPTIGVTIFGPKSPFWGDSPQSGQG